MLRDIDRRVVDQDVDAAESIYGLAPQSFHARVARDIRGARPAGKAGITQRLGRAFSGLVVDVGDDHPRPLLGEPPGVRLADAVPCSGNYCHLILQPHGYSPPVLAKSRFLDDAPLN